MNSSEIENIASQIQEVLSKNAVATENPMAIKRLQFLANSLPPGYASEKAGEIVLMAQDFYSFRKHEKVTGGAGMLMAKMRDKLSRIQ